MKTYKILFLAILIVTLSSCHKEELEFHPTEPRLQKTGFKGNLENLPTFERENCFYLRNEGKVLNYPRTESRATVNFQGQIWTLALNTAKASGNSAGTAEIWSSNEGQKWKLRKTNPFSGRKYASLVVHNNRLWMIGGVNGADQYLRDIWSSANGIDWVTESFVAPFTLGNRVGGRVTTFRNKLFVVKRSYPNTEVTVYSSKDGRRWDLDTADALGTIGSFDVHDFEAIVFNNTLNIIAIINGGRERKMIFRTTNGSDWHNLQFESRPIVPTRYAHQDRLRGTEGGSVTEYKGLVWHIGGTQSHYDILNRIWYSSDMQTWTEYSPKGKSGSTIHKIKAPHLVNHTALPFDDRLLIFGGGTGKLVMDYSPNPNVWSIYEDCIVELTLQ
ncbi:hypothetical protein [Maribacter halichondriae]|uniref:hypothetical protein n=1 Tax=Maribacter halichondriae TaxID=2980554 RepID=UPI002359EB2F|nr:hypothetical protein [Maribacter sp. Hal144]